MLAQMLWLCLAAATTAATTTAAAGDTSPPLPADGVDAARGLLTRLLPGHADSFELTALDPSSCKGKTAKCFGYSASPGGKVSIRGTSGVELSMAINHYLKYVANVSVSWEQTGGNQLSLPPDLPPPPATVHVERSTDIHYYANVCTFSYSFVWYSLADWVREIDWMALNGINLPLAYTGQEAIYQKLYNQFGVSNDSLSEYFGGPAFLAWNRGQGLQAWGGKMDQPGLPGLPPLSYAVGLPQSWIDGQWELQRQILPLMRAFGMKPVLPGFQGNVPIALHYKYPAANISRVGTPRNPLRAAFACAAWIDALDPLFNKLSDAYMKLLIEDFGTDHYYAADGTFSHAAAPWYSLAEAQQDPAFLEASAGSVGPPPPPPPSPIAIDMEAFNHSAAAYAGMSRTDPKAKWVYQVRSN